MQVQSRMHEGWSPERVARELHARRVELLGQFGRRGVGRGCRPAKPAAGTWRMKSSRIASSPPVVRINQSGSVSKDPKLFRERRQTHSIGPTKCRGRSNYFQF